MTREPLVYFVGRGPPRTAQEAEKAPEKQPPFHSTTLCGVEPRLNSHIRTFHCRKLSPGYPKIGLYILVGLTALHRRAKNGRNAMRVSVQCKFRMLTSPLRNASRWRRQKGPSRTSTHLYGCKSWKLAQALHRKLISTAAKMLSWISERTIADEAW